MQTSKLYSVRGFIFLVKDRKFNQILKLSKCPFVNFLRVLLNQVHDTAEPDDFIKT